MKAIFFLLTFTYSLVGYNIEIHYCGTELTDISVLGQSGCICEDTGVHLEVKSCHETKKVSTSCCTKKQKSANQLKRKDCCKTKRLNINNSETSFSTSKLTIEQFVFLKGYSNYLINIEDLKTFSFSLYDPPKIVVDIPVLIQAFLI